MKKNKDNEGTGVAEVTLTSQAPSDKSQNSTPEQPVSESDYLELSRLVIEHTFRVDNGRADTLYELYSENGELLLPGGTIRGRQAIRDWGQQIVQNAPWRIIRHVCGNMRFVSTGPNTAEGVTVLTVFMVAGSDAGTTLPWNVGEDHDRFVRTEQGWRLASREWVELFSRGDVVSVQ
jgi:hypothetical protein